MPRTHQKLSAQTRAERRWSRQAERDRDRRRVRTTSGRKPKRAVVINIGGPKRRKRRRGRLRVHSKRYGLFSGLWALITSVLALVWVTTGLTLYLVATLVAGLTSVILAFATFDPKAVETGPKPKPAAKSISRGKPHQPSAKRSGRSAGRPRRRPKCSARCRNSTKPITECRCSCGGKGHGKRHQQP